MSMKDGLKRAVAVVDGLQVKYRDKLREAVDCDNTQEIAQWQAYLSTLTMASMLIEKEINK